MPVGIAAYQAVLANQLPDAITQVNILQRIGRSERVSALRLRSDA